MKKLDGLKIVYQAEPKNASAIKGKNLFIYKEKGEKEKDKKEKGKVKEKKKDEKDLTPTFLSDILTVEGEARVSPKHKHKHSTKRRDLS